MLAAYSVTSNIGFLTKDVSLKTLYVETYLTNSILVTPVSCANLKSGILLEKNSVTDHKLLLKGRPTWSQLHEMPVMVYVTPHFG